MLPGSLVADRFEILAPAGSGGMGSVYRARDRHAGGEVAIKLLETDSDTAVDRFTREGQMLSDLAHPAIVRYVAHGRLPAGGRYLAMEWLEGEDLERRLEAGPLSVEEALVVGRRVADALGAAHARGVVHRDVKPSNLILVGGRVDAVKLIDFGLARPVRGPGLTRAGLVLGSLGYMAPEQVRGGSVVDARADVFALGCVLFACLTGSSPFAGDDHREVFIRILREEPARAALAHVPAPIVELVFALLAKEPDDRPRDGAAVAAAIADAAGDDADAMLGAAERRLVTLVYARGQGVTVVAGEGLASDRAARAARAALELAGAAVAVVTGWADGAEAPAELVARAAALAVAPGVRVDDVTAALLGDRFVISGAVLAGERPVDSARNLLGRPTPFVGRDRELATIEAAFSACLDGQADALLVTGPAGAGKSRLRYEALARIGDRAEVWVARGDELRAGSPYGLLAQALRRAAGVRDDEPAATGRARLRARVARHVAESEVDRIAEFIGELASVPFPDEESVQLRTARQNGALAADQIRCAWLDLVRAECEAGALLIVLEDLHWGDLPSVQLIDAVLRQLSDRPLLVLALARPEVAEVFPRLWAGCGVTVLGLPPLSRRAGERLVSEMLGAGADPATVTAILERAGGNAFFLEELIRAVAEGAREVPDTVRAMVQARLDALPADARRVLRAASVYGEHFRADDLAALAGAEAAAWLDLLVDRELVGRRGGDEHVFRHALVRDAAYATLTDDDRRAGHRAAGAWLAAAGERDDAVLAGHFERGGDAARAVGHWRRAAEQALDAGDLVAALRRVESGIACGAAGEELGRLWLIASLARYHRTELRPAREAAARAAAELAPFSSWWLVASAEEAAAAAGLGDLEPALRLAAQKMDVESRAGLLAVARLTAILASFGHVDEARALVAGLPPALDDDPERTGAIHRAHAQIAFASGALGEAVLRFAAAADWLERAGNQRGAAFSQSNLGLTLTEIGDLDGAAAALGAALATAERLGLPTVEADALHNMGWLWLARGAGDKALAVLGAACEGFVAKGVPRMEGRARCGLARVHLAAGRLADAEREASAAVEVTRGALADHLVALVLRARVLLARGDAGGALACAREAVPLVEKTARPWPLAQLVAVLRELGRDDEAAPVAARGAAAVRATAAALDDRRRALFLALLA